MTTRGLPSSLPLSVLDLSPIASGETATMALRATLELARQVEILGYRRYWLAEHHNAGALACPAPELMVGQVLAATSHLRVGSGGVMLPNHAPLRIAEAFRVLHALYPGRVDLGLGRAPGTDKRTSALLRRGEAKDLGEQLDELDGYFPQHETPRAPFASTVRAIPIGVPKPPTWLLGTSVDSARVAGTRGLGFAYAHHLSPEDAKASLEAYREAFVPSPHFPRACTILAVAAACSDDPETAEGLGVAAKIATLRFASGQRDLPMATLTEARARALTPDDEALVMAYAGRGFHGTTAHVAESLRRLVAETACDELMVMTNVADRELQRESYACLAQALRAAPP